MLRWLILLLGFVLGGCAGLPPSEPQDGPGVFINVDGTGREVASEDLDHTGAGSYTWPDGDHYEGEWRNGLPHGRGRYTDHAGVRYTGEFADGTRQGYGEQVGADEIYRGEWQGDLRTGYGELVRRDGGAYSGDWVGDRFDGFGRFDGPDGYSYDGHWNDGRREGYGRLESAGSLEYEGTWLANRRAGWGLEAGLDGSTYEGGWMNGVKDGRGELYRADGSFHTGHWESNAMLGPGTRGDPDGVQITGLWNGDFISTGLVRLPSGAEYAGRLLEPRQRRADARFSAWLERHARQRDPHACRLLATLAGPGAIRPASATLRSWLEIAAAADIAEAARQLATLEEGHIDMTWLVTAAAAGDGPANDALADLYLAGQIVPRDPLRAVGYLERAMVKGVVDARRQLAWMLATSAQPDLRDGPRALALIRPLTVRTGAWRDLAVLAAALAENGDFDGAVARQSDAVARAPVDADRDRLDAQLHLYQAGRPYRASPGRDETGP
jgi:TPR repeat protein